jgi:hypothetical protein
MSARAFARAPLLLPQNRARGLTCITPGRTMNSSHLRRKESSMRLSILLGLATLSVAGTAFACNVDQVEASANTTDQRTASTAKQADPAPVAKKATKANTPSDGKSKASQPAEKPDKMAQR